MTQSRDMPTNVDRAGLGLTLIKRSGLRIQATVQAMKSRVPLRSELDSTSLHSFVTILI